MIIFVVILFVQYYEDDPQRFGMPAPKIPNKVTSLYILKNIILLKNSIVVQGGGDREQF